LTNRSKLISENLLSALGSVGNFISGSTNVVKLGSDVFLLAKHAKNIAGTVSKTLDQVIPTEFGIKTYICIFSNDNIERVANTKLVNSVKLVLPNADNNSCIHLASALSTVSASDTDGNVFLDIVDKETLSITTSFKNFELIRRNLVSEGYKFKYYISNIADPN